MKRIFITLSLILICVSAAAAQFWYIGNTSDGFRQRIEAIDVLVMKGKFTDAAELCGEVSGDWDKTARLMDALLIHDYIDRITLDLSLMKSHLDNLNPSMYFAHSAAAKKELASVKGSEYPEFDNIF